MKNDLVIDKLKFHIKELQNQIWQTEKKIAVLEREQYEEIDENGVRLGVMDLIKRHHKKRIYIRYSGNGKYLAYDDPPDMHDKNVHYITHHPLNEIEIAYLQRELKIEER